MPGPTPLTDQEVEYIDDFLDNCPGDRAMDAEMMDGFFAALISGPQATLPSDYLPELWVGEEPHDCAEEEFDKFLELVFRHWNWIAYALATPSEVEPALATYEPLLLEEDETGLAFGNRWAIGYLRGIHLRPGTWDRLLHDEDNGGPLVPIFALAHEHNPDPKLRPYDEPVSRDRRLDLLAGIYVGSHRIYKYFEDDRRASVQSSRNAGTERRKSAKVGRNAPCPCGSGAKYKKCCGKATLH